MLWWQWQKLHRIWNRDYGYSFNPAVEGHSHAIYVQWVFPFSWLFGRVSYNPCRHCQSFWLGQYIVTTRTSWPKRLWQLPKFNIWRQPIWEGLGPSYATLWIVQWAPWIIGWDKLAEPLTQGVYGTVIQLSLSEWPAILTLSFADLRFPASRWISSASFVALPISLLVAGASSLTELLLVSWFSFLAP